MSEQTPRETSRTPVSADDAWLLAYLRRAHPGLLERMSRADYVPEKFTPELPD